MHNAHACNYILFYYLCSTVLVLSVVCVFNLGACLVLHKATYVLLQHYIILPNIHVQVMAACLSVSFIPSYEYGKLSKAQI